MVNFLSFHFCISWLMSANVAMQFTFWSTIPWLLMEYKQIYQIKQLLGFKSVVLVFYFVFPMLGFFLVRII